VALEFPGHGWSDHRPATGPGVVLAELTVYVAEAIRELQWQHGNTKRWTESTAATTSLDDNANDSIASGGGEEGSSCDSSKDGSGGDSGGGGGVTIIGHSMGAAVACLYAAAFPEHVQRLILLEGQGPLARPARDVAKHVRAHVERRLKNNAYNNSNGSTPRIYPSLDLAVKARCQTARNFPGQQWLSEAAAREMVMRGSAPVQTTGDDDDDGSQSSVQFRHDPRLLWPSLQFFTAEQNEALYQDIMCSTAFIHAEHGWPLDADQKQRFMDLLGDSVDMVECLPGSHHFHADPETAPAVAQAVLRALQK
jgi:pimeloyl-ACP methyl ester carboxylesterase